MLCNLLYAIIYLFFFFLFLSYGEQLEPAVDVLVSASVSSFHCGVGVFSNVLFFN